MIYFCADDYGIAKKSNSRIERCLKNGILNKISVLPNGELSELEDLLRNDNATLSLHVNLVEGYPLSESEEVNLLISDNGSFKYSFIGLLLHSILPKRKELKKQLYKEMQSQIKFWKTTVGDEKCISIDSHQHTHMIPLVFKTLLQVIKDEGVDVGYIRVPSEPILPYILTPSLYFEYSLTGLIKQWLLNFFGTINRISLKKEKIKTSYFMGVLFSGKMTEKRIKKLLPRYIKLAEKNNSDIELCFHPGYAESGEELIKGIRKGFKEFYFSNNRKTEYETLINFKLI